MLKYQIHNASILDIPEDCGWQCSQYTLLCTCTFLYDIVIVTRATCGGYANDSVDYIRLNSYCTVWVAALNLLVMWIAKQPCSYALCVRLCDLSHTSSSYELQRSLTLLQYKTIWLHTSVVMTLCYQSAVCVWLSLTGVMVVCNQCKVYILSQPRILNSQYELVGTC